MITYSLYGDVPKYVQGAVRNAELVASVFPGWTARFYTDLATVPPPIVSALRANGAEVVPIDMSKHGKQSMFWRFWAAADPAVERFISRDVCTHGSNVHTEHARAWAASHVCTARVCTARVCMACTGRLAADGARRDGGGAVGGERPRLPRRS